MVPEKVLKVECVRVGLHLRVGHCCWSWRHTLVRHEGAQDYVGNSLDARQEIEGSLRPGWHHECHSREHPDQASLYGRATLVVLRMGVTEAVKAVSKVFQDFLVTHQDTQTLDAVPVRFEETIETRGILAEIEISDGIQLMWREGLDIEVARIRKGRGYAVKMVDVVHGDEADCSFRQ